MPRQGIWRRGDISLPAGLESWRDDWYGLDPLVFGPPPLWMQIMMLRHCS